jgi:hypothetical protein
VILKLYLEHYRHIHERDEQNPMFMALFKLENPDKFKKFKAEANAMVLKLVSSNSLDTEQQRRRSFPCLYELTRILHLIQLTSSVFI